MCRIGKNNSPILNILTILLNTSSLHLNLWIDCEQFHVEDKSHVRFDLRTKSHFAVG